MPKTKISEFDVDPANNTDINSINIAEGCAPSGINNAIRQLMSDLKEFQTGAGGDPFNGAVNGTVGATTPNTGSFTSLTDSGNLTFTGTGNRITGDFSNATETNKVAFQTSTTNSPTTIGAIPNGTSPAATFRAINNSDPTNASFSGMFVNATTTIFESGIFGTGTYLPLTMKTGGSERLRIDTSGNVGIGTSSPSAKLSVSDGTVKIDTSPFSGTGYQGTQSNHPFAFITNNSERMRIDTSGNLLVGTTSTTGIAGGGTTNPGVWLAQGLIATQNNGDANIYCSKATGYTSSNYVAFWVNGTLVGSITTNGSATAYNTTSDYRLKENVAPMTGALDKIALLKPCTYTWKSTGEESQGFIAHELQAVVPDCVTGEKDAVDEEGKPVYQGIDTSFLVATLAASIQELKAIVDAQSERIAVLESK